MSRNISTFVAVVGLVLGSIGSQPVQAGKGGGNHGGGNHGGGFSGGGLRIGSGGSNHFTPRVSIGNSSNGLRISNGISHSHSHITPKITIGQHLHPHHTTGISGVISGISQHHGGSHKPSGASIAHGAAKLGIGIGLGLGSGHSHGHSHPSPCLHNYWCPPYTTPYYQHYCFEPIVVPETVVIQTPPTVIPVSTGTPVVGNQVAGGPVAGGPVAGNVVADPNGGATVPANAAPPQPNAAGNPNAAGIPNPVGPANVTTAAPIEPGLWTSKPADGVTIQLSLATDSRFTWTVSNQGKSSEFSGQYSMAGDTLTLARQQDGEKLSGRVALTSAKSFTFKLNKTDEKDPGLTFVR